MTMTTYGPVRRETKSSTSPGTFTKLSLLIGVLTLDFLLWPGYFGLALVFSASVVFALKLSTRFQDATLQSKVFAIGVFIAGLLPLIEVVNALTFLICAGFTFVACFALSNSCSNSWSSRLDFLITSVLFAPFQFPRLCLGLKETKLKKTSATNLLGWIVPLGFCGVFVLLFASASPIWQGWLDAIDLFAFLNVFFTPRVFFWLFLAWVIWPFLQNKASKLGLFSLFNGFTGYAVLPMPTPSLGTDWKQFAQRCLILFNLVFALQNILDFSILWGGAALPDGMSYAEYAHRGAYPLVVAALLAGAFVMVAMRPGGLGERSPLIRNLVLLWVAQNIILLMSSLLRLDIYITAYALTYWRIAAFIWMLLVAAGLLLIIARFILQRSTGWLVVANVVVLISTLYATSFINLPYHITKFNLQHSNMVHAKGSRFDASYLRRLGPNALPALADFETKLKLASEKQLARLQRERSYLFKRYSKYSDVYLNNWRAWTFREHRLQEFVEQARKEEQSVNAAEREAP